ncbi:hypothetical protein FD47_GL002386 [Lentilactobacillus parafarraginis DSM 18390 = JCM 14109]|uniref:Uncharacterized protein n=1 Tax=Lentilactobacillus parafarraginis DSM 18390 = JCM 14109 TaxID=1423786 RepID=A0A0R1YZV2_9LACO|nr:hypothetical protein FD47_GL002386 [Lentilactobacillus parafarraginis DSM 18390 = JCM 14109]
MSEKVKHFDSVPKYPRKVKIWGAKQANFKIMRLLTEFQSLVRYHDDINWDGG